MATLRLANANANAPNRANGDKPRALRMPAHCRYAQPQSSMTPEEFERLKEAEKAHLRQLKALKQQHRDAQRKKGVFDALKGIVRPDLDDVHDEMVDKLTMQNIESEARMEVALENSDLADDALERIAEEEAARDALRKSQADELVRQMKLEAGGDAAESKNEPLAQADGKTIGRVPALDEPPADANEDSGDSRGPKTIGRS